jgi:undecaprenyl-diphosphatase
LRKGSLYGFVSSHSANGFAVFSFTTSILKNRNYWFLLLFWAILFSYSRIYSGVHYPLDILGGAVLGWIIGVGCYKLLVLLDNRYFKERLPKISVTKLQNSQAGVIYLVFFVLMTTVFIVSSILHHYGYL